MKTENENQKSEQVNSVELFARFTDQNIKVYEPFMIELNNLIGLTKDLKIDGIEDKLGYDLCHENLQKFVKIRTGTEKAYKSFNSHVKENLTIPVKAKVDEVYDLIAPNELRLRTMRDAIDNLKEVEAQKAAKLAAERLEGLKKQLFDLGFVCNPFDKSWTYLEMSMTDFDLQIASDEIFESFYDTAKCYVSNELKKEKEEQEKMAEVERIANEAKTKADAELKAEQKKLADEKAEFEKVKLLQKAEADKIEKEKAELIGQKNLAINNRLVEAGLKVSENEFQLLHLLTEASIEALIKEAKEITIQKELQAKKAEEERIIAENKINNAAANLSAGIGLKVLDCKNIIEQANYANLDEFVINYIADYIAKQNAEKAEAEAQKSDKVKLTEYVEKLQAVSVPEMRSKKWNKILQLVYADVNKFSELFK